MRFLFLELERLGLDFLESTCPNTFPNDVYRQRRTGSNPFIDALPKQSLKGFEQAYS